VPSRQKKRGLLWHKRVIQRIESLKGKVSGKVRWRETGPMESEESYLHCAEERKKKKIEERLSGKYYAKTVEVGEEGLWRGEDGIPNDIWEKGTDYVTCIKKKIGEVAT